MSRYLVFARTKYEEPLELPAAGEGEEVVWDYAATGLTLRRHPLAILRPKLAAMGWRTAAQLHDLPTGRLARACGRARSRTTRRPPSSAGRSCRCSWCRCGRSEGAVRHVSHIASIASATRKMSRNDATT